MKRGMEPFLVLNRTISSKSVQAKQRNKDMVRERLNVPVSPHSVSWVSICTASSLFNINKPSSTCQNTISQ